MALYRRNDDQKGFTIIELLTVVLVINVLAAIAITSYVGLRDKARRAALVRSASSAESEIKLWLQASFDSNKDIPSVDTSFDGLLTKDDLTNRQLQIAGVALTYANGRNFILGEHSTVNPNINRWYAGPPPSPDGMIGLIQIVPTSIMIVAKGRNGELLFESVTAME